MANFNFKLLSLNARGIRNFHKRKTIFTWIKKHKINIAFLQETYSSQEIENHFKLEWRGKMLFAHGTNRSKGFSFFSVKTSNLISDTYWRIARADLSL